MLSESERSSVAVPSLKLVILGLVVGLIVVYGLMTTRSPVGNARSKFAATGRTGGRRARAIAAAHPLNSM